MNQRREKVYNVISLWRDALITRITTIMCFHFFYRLALFAH